MADEYIRREDCIQHLEKCKKGAAVTNLVWAAIMAIERDVRDMPAADVAPVVRGKPITKIREVTITEYHEARGVFASDGSNVYIKNMVYAKVPYDHCPVCGAVLCSRWHNYCGKCGAKMDGGNENDP